MIPNTISSATPLPPTEADFLERCVMEFARADFPVLNLEQTIAQVLQSIRQQGLGERIVYFYVVDDEGRLVGVIPTRRLLISPLEAKVKDIMIKSAIRLPITATARDAAEAFAKHKFLALPVVDEDGRIFGVVDIEPFTGSLGNVNERTGFDDVYSLVGLHIAQAQGATPVQSFRIRFPWLLATIASGTAAAILAGVYEATLDATILLTFFLPLVLGLSESVSMQSMTLTLGAMHTGKMSWRSFWGGLRTELVVAILLGLASGLIVGVISVVWKQQSLPSLVIGGTIALAMLASCLIGLLVPTVLHALGRDPRSAAGPITLAVADLSTLLFYFEMADLALGSK